VLKAGGALIALPCMTTARVLGANEQVKVAVIGLGGRAGGVMGDCEGLKDMRIVAVSDCFKPRIGAFIGDKGWKGYDDFRKMIEAEKPDVVYAIMPPQNLYDTAATVMEMGCDLVVEKPPALTSEQTRQMAIIAHKKGLVTAVTFQRRFAPVIRTGKKLCEERGPIHSAVATFYKNSVGQGPYYRGAIDILTSDAIHAVDTLRYLCGGEVVSVASDVRRLLADHVTVHLALVRFSSGATGVLLTNWMTGRRIFSVEIHAPGISCFGDPEEGGRIFADNKVEPLRLLNPAELAGTPADYRAHGPYDLNLHILDCVRRRVQPETNFDDALKTMELIDAIYRKQI